LFLTFSFCSANFIEEINSKNPGWTAGQNLFFQGKDTAFVKNLMGTKLNNPNKLPTLFHQTTNLPTQFDARIQWPTCIGAVRNQGDCGSCWAFGCVEALSDRFCIHSNGTVMVELAPLDVVTCDTDDDGCQGGYPENAWSYGVSSGIVLEACAPYNASIPTCPPDQQPCLNFVPTPKCPNKCVDGETWKGSKHFGQSAYSISSKVDQIATEILTNGPVEASFEVYEDFVNYKSGVYKHTTGKLLGGHAIKIIGWGVLNGEDYWLCENSWTATWGNQGFFMILKGVDECGIEAGICAGLPKLSQ